jgi:hypothetical protein
MTPSETSSKKKKLIFVGKTGSYLFYNNPVQTSRINLSAVSVR